MKKNLFLTAFSLAAILATANANASVETTPAQVKANMETDFKAEPDKADYALVQPDGAEGTLNDVVAGDYDDYAAMTVADGTNVQLKSGVNLNIAQGTVEATDYQYLSTNADGISTLVDGDTVVANLNKDYTLADGSTLNVSTAGSAAPAIAVGTDLASAVYKTGDESYYLTQVGDEILLNGNVNITADNPATFNELYALYEADVEGVAELYDTLVTYKQGNQDNFDAVATAVTTDNDAIAQIVANKTTFTTQNAQYTSDSAEYTSYTGSLAQTIDTSINNASLTTLAEAKDYADGLVSSIDTSGIAANATAISDETARATDAEGVLDSRLTSAEGAISDEVTRAKGVEGNISDFSESTTGNISNGTGTNALTLSGAIANIDSTLGTIHGLNAKRGADAKGNLAVGTTVEDHLVALDDAIGDRSQLNGDYLITGGSVAANLQSLNDGIAAANELTLTKSKTYTDSRIHKLDKEVSAGVASAVALSSVAVSNVKKGEVSVGGGYGYYNGESAMAFGAAMGLTDRWSVNAGAGMSTENVSFRAGTNYKFKLF